MVKGCQKKTIHIKDTGSRYFEEAYFVLRPAVARRHVSENDMIKEASRIAGEGIGVGDRRRRRDRLRRIALFSAGFILGAILGALVVLT